jgi:hypothetical protein
LSTPAAERAHRLSRTANCSRLAAGSRSSRRNSPRRAERNELLREVVPPTATDLVDRGFARVEPDRLWVTDIDLRSVEHGGVASTG